MSLLKGRVAVVTGAGSGIGEGIARAFVNEGACVAFVGRSGEKLLQATSDLPPERVLCYPCDVSERATVEAMGVEVAGRFGPVDLLVNNAGVNTLRRSVSEVDPLDWDYMIAVNLTGAFNGVRAVLPGMRKLKNGLIINVSSIAGKRASHLAGVAYSASKHGMVALTHSINEDEAAYGIRSTVLCPGEVNTPILEQRPVPVPQAARDLMLTPEDLAQAAVFVATLPPRACVPELIIKPTVQVYN